MTPSIKLTLAPGHWRPLALWLPWAVIQYGAAGRNKDFLLLYRFTNETNAHLLRFIGNNAIKIGDELMSGARFEIVEGKDVDKIEHTIEPIDSAYARFGPVRSSFTRKEIPRGKPLGPDFGVVAPLSASAAVVSLKEAKFLIPISNIDRQWSWDVGGDDNEMEYEWLVFFTLAKQVFGVGFTKFHFPSDRPAHGSFEQLLTAGQINGWKLRSDGAYEWLDVNGLTAHRSGNDLVVEFSDATLLTKLLKERPGTVDFETGFKLYPVNRYAVSVKYAK